MKYSVLVLLLISLKGSAQSNSQFYRFSEDIAANIERDTTPYRFQMGATAFSISGYYNKALEIWDKNGTRKHLLPKNDSMYFKSFRPTSAKDYIVERAKREKIIIINEAHHNAMHRVFTTSLLQDLYDNGYRLFGLEAVADSLINTRKYVTSESGYYTKEPQFANLINKALEIGFIVFGYETTSGANGKQREIDQAENIKKHLAKYLGAKALIHCGWDHVIEGTPGNKTWEKAMAGRLKELTNIDPLTIDQTYYSERGNPINNHPYIKMVGLKYPVIMVDGNGKTFNGSETADQTDCRIIHPVTEYINGRPYWQLLEGRKLYEVPTSHILQFPVLVLAYNTIHTDQPVPSDVIEIKNNNDSKQLILPKGTYKIVFQNKDCQIINEYLEIIN